MKVDGTSPHLTTKSEDQTRELDETMDDSGGWELIPFNPCAYGSSHGSSNSWLERVPTGL